MTAVWGEKCFVVVIIALFISQHWDPIKARWDVGCCVTWKHFPILQQCQQHYGHTVKHFEAALGEITALLSASHYKDLYYVVTAITFSVHTASSMLHKKFLAPSIPTLLHPHWRSEPFLFLALSAPPTAAVWASPWGRWQAFLSLPHVFSLSSKWLSSSILGTWVYSRWFTTVFLCMSAKLSFDTSAALHYG